MSINLKSRESLYHPVESFRTYSSHKLQLGHTYPEHSTVTDQSFRDECDINTIMARYQSTGELPYLNEMQGQFLDVSEMDFQHHMNFILEAQQMFDDLPSNIRDRFGNDPGAFLGFVNNPDNAVETAKMGLLSPEATEAVLRPPQAAPAPAPE